MDDDQCCAGYARLRAELHQMRAELDADRAAVTRQLQIVGQDFARMDEIAALFESTTRWTLAQTDALFARLEARIDDFLPRRRDDPPQQLN